MGWLVILINREMKKRKAITPRDAISVVEQSSEINRPPYSAHVKWVELKKFLQLYLTILNYFKISKDHVSNFPTSFHLE